MTNPLQSNQAGSAANPIEDPLAFVMQWSPHSHIRFRKELGACIGFRRARSRTGSKGRDCISPKNKGCNAGEGWSRQGDFEEIVRLETHFVMFP